METACLTVAFWPCASMTLRLAVKLPAIRYTYSIVWPEPTLPSPKDHLYSYGCVPPTAVPEKLTARPKSGSAGKRVKLATSGAGTSGWTKNSSMEGDCRSFDERG